MFKWYKYNNNKNNYDEIPKSPVCYTDEDTF